MRELARHIESLVLRHNCVIVPGLGGFVTQYVPARFVEGENIFLPPCRTVGFNPRLTINDGLVVQSYMQAYDTSFPEAARIVDEDVRQLREAILREGGCDIKGIGRLSLNEAGDYDFEPCEAGVLSPDLYALDSCPAVPVAESKGRDGEETAARTKSRRTPLVRRTEKNYTLSLNRELVNYAAAIVAAVVCYFLWATPATIAPAEEGVNSASILPQRASKPAQSVAPKIQNAAAKPEVADLESNSAKAATTTDAQELSGANKATEDKAAPAAPATTESKVESSKPGFAIVLASAITKRNAESYSAELQSDGVDGARVYTRGKMTRVVCGSYATREAAQAALRAHGGDSRFAQAWVIETK